MYLLSETDYTYASSLQVSGPGLSRQSKVLAINFLVNGL